MARFLCDRKMARDNDAVHFEIDALNMSDAAQAADELAYAVAWERGHYPDKDHKAEPEQWARVEAKAYKKVKR